MAEAPGRQSNSVDTAVRQEQSEVRAQTDFRINTDKGGKLLSREPACVLADDVRRDGAANSGSVESGKSRAAAEQQALTAKLAPIDLSEFQAIPDGGSEHDLFYDPKHPDSIIKATLPGEYGGIILDEKGRDALPSEYLERVALNNAVFGDKSEVLGVAITRDGPRIVVRQPFVKSQLGEDGYPVGATQEEINSEMLRYGFHKDPDYENRYVRDDGVVADDAGAGNFIKDESGKIVPIDVQLSLRKRPDS